MKKYHCQNFWCYFLATVVLLLSFSLHAQKLTLATTDWCPYTCQEMTSQGDVTAYIKSLLAKHNVDLKVLFLPWARAIQEAKIGNVDGVLTGVKSEAPFLHFTSTATSYYQSCFFALAKTKEKLQFNHINKAVIGIISEHSYGQQIDHFIANDTANRYLEVHGSEPLKRLGRLLELKRIDYFIEEINVAHYTLNDKFTPVICGEQNPFYLGLTMKKPAHANILQLLNEEIRRTPMTLRVNVKPSL